MSYGRRSWLPRIWWSNRLSQRTLTSQSLSYADLFPANTPAKIVVAPATQTVTVGTPFTVDVRIDDNGYSTTFNAAKADIQVSDNLEITALNFPTVNSCNFNFTQQPTKENPNFAGAIYYGGSSIGCTVYTLTLTPKSSPASPGTITIDNASVKAFSDNRELITGTQEGGSYVIATASPTPIPTQPLSQLTVTSKRHTYLGESTLQYTLAGTKPTSINHVYIGGSETGVTYPDGIEGERWQVLETLSLGTNNIAGDNSFAIYGSDGTNQTATQTVHIYRHLLGDIDGDGMVTLVDASKLATDWGKTENLTYELSDMSTNPPDEEVDLEDLSILAKLIQQ